MKNSVLPFSIYQNKVMVSKMKVIVHFLPHFGSLSQELLLSKYTETACWVLVCSSMHAELHLSAFRSGEARLLEAWVFVCDIASNGILFLKRNKRHAAYQKWNWCLKDFMTIYRFLKEVKIIFLFCCVIQQIGYCREQRLRQIFNLKEIKFGPISLF